MTPQEKAKELIDKYYVLQDQDAEWAMLNNARRCALICVDEIIESYRDIYDDYISSKEYGNFKNMSKFWKEVKQELEKEIQ